MRHGFLKDSDMGHGHFLNSTGLHGHFLNSTGQHYCFLKSRRDIGPPPPHQGPQNWCPCVNEDQNIDVDDYTPLGARGGGSLWSSLVKNRPSVAPADRKRRE